MAIRFPSCSSSRLCPRLSAALGAVLVLTLVALAPRPGAAKPVLTVTERELDRQPQRIDLVAWQGKVAVAILSEPFGDASKGELPARRLSLMRMQGAALTEIAAWSVSDELRWAEPLPGGNGRAAWFGLNGNTWGLADGAAASRGAALPWRALCECPSVFALGKSSLRMDTPFLVDLDGDGEYEVLLPATNGLIVHALDSRDGTLRPLWRDAWSPKERFEEQEGKLDARLSFPGYLIQDVNKDDVLDVILVRGDELQATIHPRRPLPYGGEHFAFDDDARQRLKQAGLPAPALLAVLEMGDRAFDSAEAVEAALRDMDGAALTELDSILAAARSSLPVFFPQATGLTFAEANEQESRDIVAITDMDGDRIPDALELYSTEKGDPFNQKNQIRWYPGKIENGRYVHGEPTKTYFTEGLAFVELIRLNVKGEPTLFLATMDVNVMALVKAFMLRRVTFEAYLYPWKSGALPQEAPVKGDFTFGVDLAEKGRRPMVLMADLDGDGRREFLFNLEQDKLFAFPSNPSNNRLGGTPLAEVALPLPRKSLDVLVADLDGSGRESLLVRYRGKNHSLKEQRTLRVVRLEEKAAK